MFAGVTGPWTKVPVAFVVLLAAAAAVRPPLALVGDSRPNSHVTDSNAG